MNIKLLVIGKTDSVNVSKIYEDYFNRINRYVRFELKIIKDIPKSVKSTPDYVKKKEAQLLFENISDVDYVVLLDERGKEFTSREFAEFLNKTFLGNQKFLTFVIGGAYGFDESIYERSNYKISLSKMTFSHQIVRIIFAEQLYRALSILNNDPYHND